MVTVGGTGSASGSSHGQNRDMTASRSSQTRQRGESFRSIHDRPNAVPRSDPATITPVNVSVFNGATDSAPIAVTVVEAGGWESTNEP